MIKKISILFFYILVFAGNCKTQSLSNFPNIAMQTHYGYIADEGYMYGDLIRDYVKPFEIDIYRITQGNKTWHHVYNFPEEGLILRYINLQNKDQLGSVVSIMPYLDFPLARANKFQLDLRTSIGGAYVTKVFHRTENYKNLIFSKHLNYAFNFNLKASYLIKPNFAFCAGTSFFHASNGESKTPNNGLNVNSFFVGLNYYHSGKTYQIRKIDSVPDRKFHISLYPTVGYRESLKYLGDKYFVSSATLELQRDINRKQVLGIGLAFFYDATEKVWTKHNTDPVEKDKDAIYGGIQFSHEIKLHPLYIVFQMGTYIYNYQILDGTKIYNRMGLKYHINKHVFVSFTHKSSFFFNGDNIEWGIGYKI